MPSRILYPVLRRQSGKSRRSADSASALFLQRFDSYYVHQISFFVQCNMFMRDMRILHIVFII